MVWEPNHYRSSQIQTRLDFGELLYLEYLLSWSVDFYTFFVFILDSAKLLTCGRILPEGKLFHFCHLVLFNVPSLTKSVKTFKKLKIKPLTLVLFILMEWANKNFQTTSHWLYWKNYLWYIFTLEKNESCKKYQASCFKKIATIYLKRS